MSITLDNFKKEYYKTDKKGVRTFFDVFRAFVGVLPFTSNTSTCNYDKTCGIRGITGGFFRKCMDRQVKAIEDFEANAITPVKDYLKNERQMRSDQIDTFVNVMKDIMYPDNTFTIIDSSFLKYIPLTTDKNQEKKSKKYKNGQEKIIDYLGSMLNPNEMILNQLTNSPLNLFNDIIVSALDIDGSFSKSKEGDEYLILPFIKESFCSDLKWLLSMEDSVIVKYIHVFLHFYLCYSLSQTLANLDPRKCDEPIDGPTKMFYILSSEHASVECPAVVDGWSKHVSREAQEKLFGRMQTLDILHSLLDNGKNIGFFHEVLSEYQKIDFTDDVKQQLETVLSLYQNDKRALLQNRETSKFTLPDLMDTSVTDYKDFIVKLGRLCTSLQSPEYSTKMRDRINGIMKIRLLSTRRGMEILNLDDEMLFFLVAMLTRNKRTKLDDLYKKFSEYGILFDGSTHTAIENYLLKLNLLEKKSDAGEAQYVKVIL